MKKLFCILLGFLILGGCRTTQLPPTPSIDISKIQTREFESNKKITFAAVVSTFQDLGYTINSADLETGFINAKSPSQISSGLRSSVMTDTKATAFIEEIKPQMTKVRLSLVETTETSYSTRHNKKRRSGETTIEDKRIEDIEVYENIFSKIQNNLMVRK